MQLLLAVLLVILVGVLMAWIAISLYREKIRAAESRGVERGRQEEIASRPPAEASNQQLKTQIETLKSEVGQLQLALQQSQSEVRKEKVKFERMTAEKNKLGNELHQTQRKMDKKRSRKSLIEEGWLPLHASCFPAYGEHILVGGIADAVPLLPNELGGWFAVFDGEENGRVHLGNGRGDGRWVDADGKLLWFSHAQWQTATERSRMNEALRSLVSSNGAV